MDKVKAVFLSIAGILGINTSVLALVSLTDIENFLRIGVELVTIVCTILITKHQLRK